MMYRCYFWSDGVLDRSPYVRTLERAKANLDVIQKEWSRHLGPLVKPGEFDPNNGHEVNRVSDLELLITTTGNHKLRFLYKEVKQRAGH